MKATKAVNLLCVIWAVGSLVGCQQAERSFTTEEATQELASMATDDGTQPVAPSPITTSSVNPPAPGRLPDIPKEIPFAPQFCTSFLKAAPVVIDMNATNNVVTEPSGSDVLIKSANTVTLNPGGGVTQILSAITVLPFNAAGGPVSINALTIQGLTISGGSLTCLHADRIGRINVNGGGDQIVIANNVESIQVGSGRLHILGGVIAELATGNGGMGVLCLHDGAKVVNWNGYVVTLNLGDGCSQIEKH
jgi:hypothetical protein